MVTSFFDNPILNSPYDYPQRHWQLDARGQPTQTINPSRRGADFITPVPAPRKRNGGEQSRIGMDQGAALATEKRQYDHMAAINGVREQVDRWRARPADQQQVTPQTARLLAHWRQHPFNDIRPFFCQLEAVETVIWLTEVAPRSTAGQRFIEHLKNACHEANPGLSRLALKLATGAGKTTVMAMLIAWQTANAVRRPASAKYSRGFLIITPSITIRDRLRVLQPNDPDSYYRERELLPADMRDVMRRAVIVITNYHAFKPRERVKISKGTRQLLQGRGGAMDTVESRGQMLQRVMSGLMGMKNIMAINDEAHHCYREKAEAVDEEKLRGDNLMEARKNTEAARLWISGIEAVNQKLGVARVMDLSATPFFLRGSGYAEGTLFPWTMCDFSLMDAIECGIVKLPRVPVADNIAGEEMPKYRNLWAHIGAQMPKKRRGSGADYDPLSLPTELQIALDALYGHYEKVSQAWAAARTTTDPCFIVVCNNTATSKLIYDYISGFESIAADGVRRWENGRLPLFRNYCADGTRLARPRTLLIDSVQLESGDALDSNFRKLAADEIHRFRREIIARTGDRSQGENITDQDLLREVMNTVGKPGRLGDSIRCVVSVSMLTEGWDANTVTHILGVRAFGTQLLCEQVVGRALRRQSYALNDDGLFDVEYADILGIPFDFTAKPVVVAPAQPKHIITVQAMRPQRDSCAITYPRVTGYRTELPAEKLSAKFTDDSTLELNPDLVGPTQVKVAGIIGEAADLNVDHLDSVRHATLAFNLTRHLLYNQFREPGAAPKLHLFGQLKRITQHWMAHHLVCEGGTYPGFLMYQTVAALAAVRITCAITRAQSQAQSSARPVKAILDPYNPLGSTAQVRFTTSKTHRWETDSRRCHINWAILDSDWEGEFCRLAEAHPQVRAYVKNHNLGFDVPYRSGAQMRKYRPDFIAQIDDGNGADDPLNLVVEIKGFRGEDAKDKKSTMENYWLPGVNNHRRFGRWAFAEFTAMHTMQTEFDALVGGFNAATAKS